MIDILAGPAAAERRTPNAERRTLHGTLDDERLAVY
jgi:hypothetical protein